MTRVEGGELRVPVSAVAPLLFCSGACALVYQVAWLRELRLVFGASTAATAAVLAIFLGGLGVGGALLGRRADRSPSPLGLYAHLELAIAATAALTPLLTLAAREAYVLLGGSTQLGTAGATAVRLLLSVVVLGVPTVLMGGTLPAAVRAVESADDPARRRLATLYGANTLGAVTGAAVSTFLMLEVFGTRQSLWLACLVNALVGISARALARTAAVGSREAAAERPAGVDPGAGAPLPRRFVYLAAGVTGFAFILMELVWYRMLGPLLGGSTYTFGLILAVALLGIGLGGGAFAFRPTALRATPALFACTCGLEALALVVPFAMGDRVAILAALLHPLGAVGLYGQVLGWTLVTALVVLPAALVAGFQFPVLIGLLGAGEREVGQHTGFAYAWNTGGSILASLAGGFVLLPWLTATGSWQLAVVLMAALAVVAGALAWARGGGRATLAVAGVAVVLAVAQLGATGPTAAWRHSPIGAGRVDLASAHRNEIRDWMAGQRRAVVWEAEGLETSVGLAGASSYAFIINGKVDGNARGDAATMVMFGLVPAALHPDPRTALVVGLGTGASAGWLAEVGSMERVDVVELEPAIVEVARRCAPVNHGVVDHPKVNLVIADGREVLLTTRERYDLIASQPSNPYRAGIASLYTVEFYRAVAERLAPGGIFAQWMQAYEVDALTVQTVYATLMSVFPVVETWQTKSNDLLLLCSMEERPWDLEALRTRLDEEPFRSAQRVAWGTQGVEGFLARYVAGPGLAARVARDELAYGRLSTDDRMRVEFGFARTVGTRRAFSLVDVWMVSRTLRLSRPPVPAGQVDWERVDDNRFLIYALDLGQVPPEVTGSTDQRHRVEAANRFLVGDYEGVLAAWRRQPRPPLEPLELIMVGEAAASTGDPDAPGLARQLDDVAPIEANAFRAAFHLDAGDPVAARLALEAAFQRLRTDPWAQELVVSRALSTAATLARVAPDEAPALEELLSEPFAVRVVDERRRLTRLEIARLVGDERAAAALRDLEPDVPWQGELLAFRQACYERVGDPRAGRAAADLESFLTDAPVLFETLAR